VPRTERPLGRSQHAALQSLARVNGGSWLGDCWQIGTLSNTARILDSLVERGLATRTTATRRYTITEPGLNALGFFTCCDCARLTRYPLLVRPYGARARTRCHWCAPATSSGLCERCGGSCTGGRPGPRITARGLEIARSSICILLIPGAAPRPARHAVLPSFPYSRQEDQHESLDRCA
jgi:hypothetical protein